MLKLFASLVQWNLNLDSENLNFQVLALQQYQYNDGTKKNLIWKSGYTGSERHCKDGRINELQILVHLKDFPSQVIKGYETGEGKERCLKLRL